MYATLWDEEFMGGSAGPGKKKKKKKKKKRGLGLTAPLK